jgi:hypothetical protein
MQLNVGGSPASLEQQFDAAAAESAWSLNDATPSALAIAFATAATETELDWWGGPASMFFADDGTASYVYVGAGGISFGGDAEVIHGKEFTGTGGFVLSGSAAIQHGAVVIGAGGISFSGTALVQHGKAYAGAGGLVFAGEAAVEHGAGAQSFVYTGDGGVLFGGTADMLFEEGGAAQPAVDGPWRKLSGEYPKPNKRRKSGPLLEPVLVHFPPPLSPRPPAAPAPIVLVVSGESPYRDVIAGELVAPVPRETPPPAELEMAIALLLAA